MKTEEGKAPSRRWIRERSRAILQKFWYYLEDDDLEGFQYWLIYEAELNEDSLEFQAAMEAWREKRKTLRRPR